MTDLTYVLKLTVLSMTVVFASLLLISFMLELFRVLFYKDSKTKEVKNEEKNKKTTTEPVDLSKEQVLAAIFTAAVAASNGKKASNLRIKSIRKIS